jgi:hypothetical protein
MIAFTVTKIPEHRKKISSYEARATAKIKLKTPTIFFHRGMTISSMAIDIGIPLL